MVEVIIHLKKRNVTKKNIPPLKLINIVQIYEIIFVINKEVLTILHKKTIYFIITFKNLQYHSYFQFVNRY